MTNADGRLLLDHALPGQTRCYVDCPVAGYRREVAVIVYRDGGRLAFPIDLSQQGDTEQFRKALPQRASGDSYAFGEVARDNGEGFRFYAKSGGYGPNKTTSTNGRTGNMKRLVNLRLMDPVANIYAAPACAVLGVFDGDVMLEDSLYMVDPIDNRIKLKRSPVFEVRALVSC